MPSFLRFGLILVALLGLGLGLLFALDSESRADGDRAPHIIYMNITGDGPTAKAWYKGAPPAGVPVQDALDRFAAEGYRVARVSPSQRPVITAVISAGGSVEDRSQEEEQYFLVLLQR